MATIPLQRTTDLLKFKPNDRKNETNNKSVANGAITSDTEVVFATQPSLANLAEDPKQLIPELCNHFYNLGWASGTGGGLSIRQNGYIFCAPSGVQKERIKPDDMFILNESAEVIERPLNPTLKVSECLSLFMVPFKLRNAGCCIHSHSIQANLITAIHSKQYVELRKSRRLATSNGRPGGEVTKSTNGCSLIAQQWTEFRVSHQEMIKGIKRGSSDQSHQCTDTLVVPIIDNVLHERDLAGAMQEAVEKYPLTNAVLVRNHGVYVWGKTWKQAKSMAECYDYLFKLKLEAAKCGFDWMLDE